MKYRIVQVTAGCTPGDAITGEVEYLHRGFRAAPARELFGSSIVTARHIAPGLNFPARDLESFEPKNGDVILYHHSIASQLPEAILKGNHPRFLIYHNITPDEYFRPYNSTIAAHLAAGRAELREYVHRFDGFFADSSFNARELKELGCSAVRVKPVLFESGDMAVAPGRREARDGGGANVLFVGRIVPNKGYGDLIKIFHFLKRILPDARLTLAGAIFPGTELYLEELRRLIRYLDLEESVEITGYLERGELLERYRRADLFLCASHHEGFCVPLLEAMLHGVPVLAYAHDESAAEETLGGAGAIFRRMEHASVAEAAAAILRNDDLAREMIQGQRERLERIRPEEIFSDFFQALREAVINHARKAH